MICLVMIVKNEAAVLERCLRSARDFCGHAVICDTGSNVREEQLMLNALNEVYGPYKSDMVRQDWQNFGYNRTMALHAAHEACPKADYFLMMDADDVLVWDGEGVTLTHDCYSLDIVYDGIRYDRVQIFKRGLGWHYRGVLHEFPETDKQGFTQAKLAGVHIQVRKEGARSKDPDLYLNDAKVLKAAFEAETDEFMTRRYCFYLAQSYRDAKDYINALYYYDLRSKLGGWSEEIYVCLYEMMRIELWTTKDGERMINYCREAQTIVPERRECVHLLAHTLRVCDQFDQAAALIAAFSPRKYPVGSLFGVPAVYEWQLWDEWALSLYYCGDYKGSLNCAVNALKGNAGRTVDMPRLIDNIVWAAKKLM